MLPSVLLHVETPVCVSEPVVSPKSKTNQITPWVLWSKTTSKRQKGFIKGRFIKDHLFNAFGAGHDMDIGYFIFIDFAKA